MHSAREFRDEGCKRHTQHRLATAWAGSDEDQDTASTGTGESLFIYFTYMYTTGARENPVNQWLSVQYKRYRIFWVN